MSPFVVLVVQGLWENERDGARDSYTPGAVLPEPSQGTDDMNATPLAAGGAY